MYLTKIYFKMFKTSNECTLLSELLYFPRYFHQFSNLHFFVDREVGGVERIGCKNCFLSVMFEIEFIWMFK